MCVCVAKAQHRRRVRGIVHVRIVGNTLFRNASDRQPDGILRILAFYQCSRNDDALHIWSGHHTKQCAASANESEIAISEMHFSSSKIVQSEPKNLS